MRIYKQQCYRLSTYCIILVLALGLNVSIFADSASLNSGAVSAEASNKIGIHAGFLIAMALVLIAVGLFLISVLFYNSVAEPIFALSLRGFSRIKSASDALGRQRVIILTGCFVIAIMTLFPPHFSSYGFEGYAPIYSQYRIDFERYLTQVIGVVILTAGLAYSLKEKPLNKENAKDEL